MMPTSMSATYEDGMLKLRGKLPLRNHAKVRLVFLPPTSVAARTCGLLKGSRRVAHLIAESDDLSVLNS